MFSKDFYLRDVKSRHCVLNTLMTSFILGAGAETVREEETVTTCYFSAAGLTEISLVSGNVFKCYRLHHGFTPPPPYYVCVFTLRYHNAQTDQIRKSLCLTKIYNIQGHVHQPFSSTFLVLFSRVRIHQPFSGTVFVFFSKVLYI